jgi:hypothetical protein
MSGDSDSSSDLSHNSKNNRIIIPDSTGMSNWYILPVMMFIFGFIGILGLSSISQSNFDFLLIWCFLAILLFLLIYFLESISWLKKSVSLLSEEIALLKSHQEKKNP